MTVVSFHTWPAGDPDTHWLVDCPCGPIIEIKSRNDGSDGHVIAHQRFDEEEAA